KPSRSSFERSSRSAVASTVLVTTSPVGDPRRQTNSAIKAGPIKIIGSTARHRLTDADHSITRLAQTNESAPRYTRFSHTSSYTFRAPRCFKGLIEEAVSRWCWMLRPHTTQKRDAANDPVAHLNQHVYFNGHNDIHSRAEFHH